MKAYVLSGLVGIVVGVLYGALGVRSPAPPVVALVGLLGMLGGEQVGKRLITWYAPPRTGEAGGAQPGTAAPAQAPAQAPGSQDNA